MIPAELVRAAHAERLQDAPNSVRAGWGCLAASWAVLVVVWIFDAAIRGGGVWCW